MKRYLWRDCLWRDCRVLWALFIVMLTQACNHPRALHVIDPVSGQTHFTLGAVTATLHVREGLFFVIHSEGGALEARDPESGAIRWEAKPQAGKYYHSLNGGSGILITTEQEKKRRDEAQSKSPKPTDIVAFDMNTGKEKWRISQAFESFEDSGSGPSLRDYTDKMRIQGDALYYLTSNGQLQIVALSSGAIRTMPGSERLSLESSFEISQRIAYVVQSQGKAPDNKMWLYHLKAINIDSGALQWSAIDLCLFQQWAQALSWKGQTPQLVITSAALYVVQSQSGLFCLRQLDPMSGAERWRDCQSRPPFLLQEEGNRVGVSYANARGDESSKQYRLLAHGSGQESSNITFAPSDSDHPFFIMRGDAFYAITSVHSVQAFHMTTGAKLWSIQTSENDYNGNKAPTQWQLTTRGDLVLGDALIRTKGACLSAYDQKTGQILWEQEAQYRGLFSGYGCDDYHVLE